MQFVHNTGRQYLISLIEEDIFKHEQVITLAGGKLAMGENIVYWQGHLALLKEELEKKMVLKNKLKEAFDKTQAENIN